jgi:hypothetical protein
VVTPSIGSGCFLRAAAAYSLLAGLKRQMYRSSGKVQFDPSPYDLVAAADAEASAGVLSILPAAARRAH